MLQKIIHNKLCAFIFYFFIFFISVTFRIRRRRANGITGNQWRIKANLNINNR